LSDPRITYLLPCSCGKEVSIELRQAGETVRCECGQACAVPTMREVRCLRPAPASETTPADTKPAWGNSQRFLVAGLVVVLLAAVAAIILYRQSPTYFVGLPSPEAERQFVERLPILATLQYFHQRILPGIDIPEPAWVQSKRSMVSLGMATLSGVGAIGLILLGVGVAGIVRRR